MVISFFFFFFFHLSVRSGSYRVLSLKRVDYNHSKCRIFQYIFKYSYLARIVSSIDINRVQIRNEEGERIFAGLIIGLQDEIVMIRFLII